MSNNVSVIYNGNEINPPPFVSRTQNPLDYGKRWGYEDSITLRGQYYVGNKISGIVSDFANLFTGQFSRFQVLNFTGSGLPPVVVLDYPFTVLDEISFDSNHFFPNTYVPYTVKLKNINVPSGVVEPSNEYSFAQNEDGTVIVSHKVSARGIVTSSSFDSALQNAKTFVQRFTGISPFGPAFVAAGAGALLSQAEALDRLTASYSMTESYKYNSGESLDYFYIHSLDSDVSADLDYRNINFNYSRQGSTITSDLSQLRAGISTFDIYQFLQNSYGVDTGNLYLNSYNVSEESGKNSIQITANIISGIGDEFSGFFDYDIDLKWDNIMDVRQFSINGKFASRAPVSLRKTFLSNFLSGKDVSRYVYDIVTGSYVYENFTGITQRALNDIPSSYSITENTGLAEFSVSATFTDKDFIQGYGDASFSVAADVPKNIYEFKPSANIEGNYVIQDLRTLTRENLKLSCDIKTTGNVSGGFIQAQTVESGLSSALLNGAFLIESGFNTGIFDVGVNTAYLNSGSRFGLDTRVKYSSNPASIRPSGYLWGL